MSLKILHMSDLHICTPRVRDQLQHILETVTELTDLVGANSQLDFEFADQARLVAIQDAVTTVNPDVICITGDITTFGDKESYAQAIDFAERLCSRSSDIPRKLVITPGNHDVMCSQVKRAFDSITSSAQAMRRQLPFYVRPFVSRFLQKKAPKLQDLARLLSDLLSSDGVRPNIDNPLLNFQAFFEEARCTSSVDPVGKAQGYEVWCIPFNSVSFDPLWVNIGEGRPAEFRRFRERLRSVPNKKNAIVITLVHHNPISAAERVETHLVHAYNSFPGASLYVKEMQDDGVDIILYGHQHASSCAQMDFVPSKPGHLYLIGASSATAKEGGFNLLQIEDRFHGTAQRFQFTKSGNYLENGGPDSLVFERERTDDMLTMGTRHEIRRTTRKPVGLDSSYAMRPGARDLLIVRPRGEQLRTDESLSAITRVLEPAQCEKVRILVTDPSLFELVATLPEEAKTRLGRMWGEKLSWENQSFEARQTLARLLEFRNKLPATIRPKLEIRKAHTLMPVGALIRTDDAKEKTLVIRLLPVGLMFEFDRPELMFETRVDQGVPNFYCKYLEALWTAGVEMPQPDMAHA